MTMTPTTPPAHVPVEREPSWIAMLPFTAWALAWRTRWHTAPVTAGFLVWLVGSAAPGVVALTTGVVGGLAYRAARHPHQRKRMILSVRERDTLALWAAGCTVWALAVYAAHPAPSWSAGGLALLTVWPAVRWVGSRKVRVARHDRATKDHVRKWGPATSGAPIPLQGSHVIKTTIRNPAPGATVFDVQLTDGVHAANAVTEECRRAIEARYRQGAGTVTLSLIRRDVTKIRVAISPERHLEGADGVPYDAPVIDKDGRLPIAVTPTGEVVGPRLGTEEGVKHALVLGVTGAGKSTTVKTLILPPAVHRRAIFVYVDGSGGRTLRREGLRPFFTVAVSRERWQWRHAIHLAHAILLDREARASEGDFDWTTPWVYLVIEEAPAVGAEVGSAEHEMVRDITARGRAVFVGSIQIAQGANAEDIVGGVKARGNSTQIITHRPLDPVAMMKALATVPGFKNIDLFALPPEPGWVAIVDNGQVWPQARIKYVTAEHVADLADGFEPLQFTGDDLTAAAPHLAAIHGEAPEPEPAPETEAEQITSRARLVKVLRAHGPSTVGQIAPKDPAGKALPHVCDLPDCPGWPVKYRQTSKHLLNLQVEGLVDQEKEGSAWFAVN